MGKKFTAPEKALAELSNEELAEFTNAAREVGAEFAGVADADLSNEDADTIIAVGEFLSAATEESAAREAASAERAERLSAARQAMSAASEDDGDEDGDSDDETEEERIAREAAEEEARKAEAAAASAAQASARRSSFSARAAKRTPAPKVEKAAGVTISAAADVKGVPAGKSYSSLSEAGEAIRARIESMPNGNFSGRLQHGALQFKLPENKFTQTGGLSDSEMLMQAASERRLEGGSLVAAGGWAAPSERLLDFCELEDIGDLIQLPEITITRGGIQYTKGPTFADVLGSATGFWDMTEAVAEAGTELKTALRPEAPEFEEERLDATGVMVEAGLLTRAGWPELVERYASLAMTAHEYKKAMKTIALIQGHTGAAKALTGGFGNVTDALHLLELVAMGERQKNAMSLTATLEALVPFWFKAAVRAALANRHGLDHLAVTDQQIDSWFAARNIRVQWLAAYQNLELDANGIATEYPETFEVIMYPAGTYVRGVKDVVSLDTVYDSVNLKKNDYVHLFVEQGVLVTNPCGEGQRLTLPLNVNGRLAADDITKSFNALP